MLRDNPLNFESFKNLVNDEASNKSDQSQTNEIYKFIYFIGSKLLLKADNSGIGKTEKEIKEDIEKHSGNHLFTLKEYLSRLRKCRFL